MKIVYLAHQFYPFRCYGAGLFVYKQARAALEAGNSVHVITRLPSLNLPERIRRRLSVGLQARIYYYDQLTVTATFPPRTSPAPYSLGETPARIARAVKILDRSRPDVLHAGHLMGVMEFWLAAEQLGIPRILTLTDYWSICPKIQLQTSSGEPCTGPRGGVACAAHCPELPDHWVRARLAETRRIFAGAVRVVAPSVYLQQVFQAEMHEDRKIDLIPHGVQPGFIELGQQNLRMDRPLTFMYAGSLVPHKGAHVLVEAFKKVESADARLLIYGSGTSETGLQNMAQSDPRIKFCGFYTREQTIGVLQQADVVIVPSLWPENCPQIVLEAQAARIPVIAAQAGNLPNLVQHNQTGFLFPPGDVPALADLLSQIVSQPELLARCRKFLHTIPQRTVANEFASYLAIYQSGVSHAHA